MRIWTPVSEGVGVPFTAHTFAASGVIAAMYAPGRVLPYAIGTPACALHGCGRQHATHNGRSHVP